MELRGKALFNLLRIRSTEDPKTPVKPWQVEDLRDLSIEELFTRLKKLGVILNEQSFSLYAENSESPEDLVDCVWLNEEDLEGHDQAYLLVFELWRKLLPDKLCLSILCDELDHLIDLYDQELLEDQESLQKALSILEDVLDDAYDEKGDPKEIFSVVSSFCAHDLESFIVDYISDQIAERNEMYASELIDAFYDYSSEPRRFALLRAQLLALFDLEKSSLIYERLLEELQESPDFDLLLRVMESLIHHENDALFMQSFKLAQHQLKTEEHLQNILLILAEYYGCLDREKEEEAVKKILDSRSSYPLQASLNPADKVLSQLTRIHNF